MLALLVLVVTSPEPSSSAFTNATSQRSLEAAPRKPSRRARAKEALQKIEADRDAYLRLRLTLDQRSLLEMSRSVESLEKRYLAVMKLGDAKTTVEAWADIAEIYRHFADQIRSVRGVDPAELEAMARGPEQRAREAIERGLAEARRRNVRSARLQRIARR